MCKNNIIRYHRYAEDRNRWRAIMDEAKNHFGFEMPKID